MKPDLEYKKQYDEQELTAETCAIIGRGFLHGVLMVHPEEAMALIAITFGLCRSPRAAAFVELGMRADDATAEMMAQILSRIHTRLKQSQAEEDARLAAALQPK